MRAEATSDAFQKVVEEIPTGMPRADGAQRIKNASRQLSKAREEMIEAHRALVDYIVFVSEWRFTPGMKDGMPVSVPCSIDLMWGPQNITAVMIDKFQATDARFQQRR